MRSRYKQPMSVQAEAKRRRVMAQIRGDRTYDPGFACRNGHTSLRRVQSNNCVECHRRANNPHRKVHNATQLAKTMMGRVYRNEAAMTSATYSDNGAGKVVMTICVTAAPARPRETTTASPIPRLLPRSLS